MTADVNFRQMLNRIAHVLKTRGFQRQGNTFCWRKDNNLGLISFQRSCNSNRDLILFAVNLGVISELLFRFFNPSRDLSKPELSCSQWQERLGFLLPARCDQWWEITDESSVERVTNELCDALIKVAIPEISRLITNEALRDLWVSGKSPGLTNLSRLVNLSVLLHEIGPAIALPDVLSEYRKEAAQNAVSAGTIERHLSRVKLAPKQQ